MDPKTRGELEGGFFIIGKGQYNPCHVSLAQIKPEPIQKSIQSGLEQNEVLTRTRGLS